jgi:hemerythrin
MNSKQSVAAWSDEYALGLDEIDEQHKYLFSLINDVWLGLVNKAERRGRNAPGDGAGKLYRDALFGRRSLHARTALQPLSPSTRPNTRNSSAASRGKKPPSAGKPLSLELVHFLRDWLVQHIRFTDRAYADEFRDREKAAMKGSLGKFFRRFLG